MATTSLRWRLAQVSHHSTSPFACSLSLKSSAASRKLLPMARVARESTVIPRVERRVKKRFDDYVAELDLKFLEAEVALKATQKEMESKAREAKTDSEISVALNQAYVSSLESEALIAKKKMEVVVKRAIREDDEVQAVLEKEKAENRKREDALSRLKEEYTVLVAEEGFLSMRWMIEEAEDTRLSYFQKCRLNSRIESWELICKKNPEFFASLQGCNSEWATEADVAGAVVQFYSNLSSHTHKICRLEYGVAMDIPERICTKATLLLASAIASLTNFTVEFYYTSES